ncbi:MAG: DUF4349 domain-containing protein, partial [Lachnospiraceae bacterium]|nr:DUF4349 domain-containing protein [Lachnospiraceae bacterium]
AVEEIAFEEEAASADAGAVDTAAGGAAVSMGNAAEVKVQEPEEPVDMENAASRKLIRNVSLDVETENFDELLVSVGSRTTDTGGYIEESYTYNGSSYYGNARKSADLTIRIPAGRLDGFLSAVSEVSNVISRNENVTDVTLQYVDMESRKKALEAEHERLLELLAKAENVEDIIAIESRLSEVRYQMESMESQLRTLDNQVSYSTVNLHISEVEKLTPVKEQNPGERIAAGFLGSLSNIGKGLSDFGIGFLINLPYVVFAAAVVLAVLAVVGLIVRKRKKGQEKERDTEKEKDLGKDKEESQK